LLRPVVPMADRTIEPSKDWLRGVRTNLIAWWIPQAAIVAGLLFPIPARTAVWIVALTWNGTACLLNAKRCGRTHCHYTGPFYLVMIAPVAMLASGIIAADWYGWLGLAVVILAGSKLIWFATERAWGKFS
jgi:hypothetical protein